MCFYKMLILKSDKFIYLGSVTGQDDNCDEDNKSKVGMKKQITKLKPLVCNKKLVKKEIFQQFNWKRSDVLCKMRSLTN